jgi:poly(3-hydroxybutyrate) depolymerase
MYQVGWWAGRTCGDSSLEMHDSFDGYNTTRYSCEGLEDVVQHYQVFDLGHCWPNSRSDNYDASSALDQSKRKCLDRSLDFTPVVLDFFNRWNSGNKP